MPRLFSALVPPEPAIRHLARHIDSSAAEDVRWVPVATWHVTLGFFGDADDLTQRAAWLRARITGSGPRLRLAGGGSFPGVLWIGVAAEAEPGNRRLAEIAEAAGAGLEDREFRPHLTVARARRRQGRRAIDALAGTLADYVGPQWLASEVVLFSSQQTAEGPHYREVERFPLA
jgi:2'-5' RNA ligase